MMWGLAKLKVPDVKNDLRFLKAVLEGTHSRLHQLAPQVSWQVCWDARTA